MTNANQPDALRLPPGLPTEYDGIFVGGGHNALIAAAYLAKAGLSTLVLESGTQLGGGVCTEEITLPLFRHNLHAYFVRWTPDDRIWYDLDLDRYGVHAIHPDVQNAIIHDGGAQALVLQKELGPSLEAIRALDKDDAERYAELHAEFSELTTRLLAPLRFAPPLPVDEERELLARSRTGRRYLELADRSALDLIQDWFTSEPLRALLLFNVAVRGYLPHLDVPGTGYLVPLVLPAGHEVRLIAGGSATMAHALAAALYDSGGRALTRAPVARIDVTDGRATGVETTDGRRFRARRFVASSVPAPITLRELVESQHLDPSLRDALAEYRWLEEALFGVHLALADRPRFTAEAAAPDLPRAVNLGIGYESSDDLIRDMEALKAQRNPHPPALHSSIPTLHDESQAPPGGHTTFGWQFVASRPEGREDYWDTATSEAMAVAMIDRYAQYAPNLPEVTLGVGVHTPADTEAMVPSMRYGDRHHGSYHPDNWGARRPHEALSGFRTPIDGLYLCGSSQHPGGSFTGSPGFNAAGVIADDLGIQVWWPRQSAREIITALE